MTTPIRTRGVAVAAGTCWLLAYLAVVLSGQRFRTGYLEYGWQLVPWNILVDDPIGSVWYLHIQPPLWNLLLGSTAALSPVSDALTLQVLMMLVGVALAATVAAVLRPFVGRGTTAVGLALLGTLNPEVLHTAFEPTYELGVALLIALVALTVQRAASATDGRWLVRCSVAITALVLTRSLYHPLLVPVVLLLAWLPARRRIDRRRLIAALAVPIVLVGGWLLKNEILFGRATMSSWVGMNLQRSTIPIVERSELEEMAADGQVSEIALLGPFGNYGVYRDAMPPCEPTHDHPSLTVEGRPDAAGVIIPNFNYECYLPIYDRAMDDFRAVARAHPDAWWEGRVFSARMTFATSGLPDASPSRILRGVSDLYHLLRVDATLTASTTSWGTPIYGSFDFDFRFSLMVVLLYAIVAGAAAVGLARRGTPQRSTLLVVGLLAAVTVVVGVVGELGEQARFRSVTDALVVPLGVLLLSRLLRRWLGRPTETAP